MILIMQSEVVNVFYIIIIASNGMGARMGVQLLVREIYLSLTNHPGQLSLAISPV